MDTLLLLLHVSEWMCLCKLLCIASRLWSHPGVPQQASLILMWSSINCHLLMQFPLAVSYFGLWTAFLSSLSPLNCLLPCSYPTKCHILSLYWHCHYGSFSLIQQCHISVLSTCQQILPCSDSLSQTRKPEQKWPHSGLRHAPGGQWRQGYLVKYGKERSGSQNIVAVKLAEEVLVPEKIAGALWKWWWRGGGEESPHHLRCDGGVHASCTGLAEWCVVVPEVRTT